MKGMDLQNHYVLKSADEVNQICTLLQDIGVSYFNYLKIYKDGSRELLTNNAPWIDHFYQNALYLTAGVVDVEHLLPKGYFLWSELDSEDPVYSQGRESFNIDNGVSFVIKRDDVTYLYIFASTKDNVHINNYYVRNIDLFKRFIQHFQDRGADLIKQSAKNRIFLPERQIVTPNRLKDIEVSLETRTAFYKKTEMDKFYLLSASDDLYLTPKQAEVSVYLVAGVTAKQCARHLGISHRTVETYIEEMKQKIFKVLGINLSKDELAIFLKKTGIQDVVFPDRFNKHVEE
ncbi:two-component sensor histidine kinase [Candidatus Rickettsiella viridis]|uniref:Two-component sensor histidine kinase n=1 Tax=Candidatus Rickettsiella viridis TaxID=676208 RepID=A0A2Z5V2N3_9COXI|nr:LuxR C-terminal-related transcriptional regulator [Candidatus Rickettsiella viridis]BBB14722.1 two-component sensor histidine kinase [Candidatus Rickettsiella viridis]